MRSTFPRLLTPLLFLAVLLAASCRQPEKRSELFSKIFKQERGTFRGVDLGDKLEEAKEQEGIDPKHDDQWGYVYEFNLGGKKRYYVEYICRDPKQRKVNSIVSNIMLEEKSEASELFTEMELYLRQKYGAADGSLGNLKWTAEDNNLLVALRMLDDKKSISLNFVPVETF